MARKSLGIIGKGHVVKRFFSDMAVKDYTAFAEQFAAVYFYNYGYLTDDDFKKTDEFRTVEKRVESLASSVGEDVELTVNVRGSSTTFVDFFAGCDVILDASEGYVPGRLKRENKFEARPGSLYELAVKFSKGEEVSPSGLDWRRDYDQYCVENDNTTDDHKGRIPMNQSDFEKHWQSALEILCIVNEVHRQFPIGRRMLLSFPFSADILVERGKQLSQVVREAHALPTYITVVNEPCMAATVLGSLAPAMVPYLVACTGFDVERLNMIFNDTYRAEKERAGYRDFVLRVRMKGFHDDGVMIPLIVPERKEDQSILAEVLLALDFSRLYSYLKDQVQSYFQRYDAATTSRQVSNALYNTILAAVQSRGKCFSLLPRLPASGLSNGYFHQNVDDVQGMFLVGNHKFRNGKVVADE